MYLAVLGFGLGPVFRRAGEGSYLQFMAPGVIGSSLKEMQGFQLVMNFLVMPLWFLSGALYPLQGLPAALAVLTRVDPLTYGVDGVRGIMVGNTHFGVALDVGVLLGVGVLFVIAGA